MNLPSYPKVWNIGHPSVRDLFLDNVYVQEKVDGSQFSFCNIPGVGLQFRSKGAEVIPGAAGMFTRAVEAITEIAAQLSPGIIYRGEYLQKPKHNTLAYDRVPVRNIILFDINRFPGADEETTVAREAERLGMEVVPTFFIGKVESAHQLRSWLEQTSILGGAKIEGVVVKNYGRYHLQTSDPLFGKFVSEAFKEQHGVAWKAANPAKADVVEAILVALRSERRWEKAVEFLRDGGTLQSAPQDIGPLLRRVTEDVEAECSAEIKEALFKWAWPQIKRRVAAGLPEWYKQRLLDGAFA